MSPTLLAVARDKRIRPSALGAIALCAARPTMEAAVVDAEGEPVAAEEATLGKVMHAWTQDVITEWINGVPWGDAIAKGCNSATLNGCDPWSIWCLQFALEFLRDLITQNDIAPENVLTEHTLDMESIGFTQGGTADVVLVVPGKLVIVIDWKFGYLDQGDAEDNDQTQAYAAAAAETFKTERVEVCIVQPRAEKKHRVSRAHYPAETLRSNRAWTASVINLARADNPELSPSYGACIHCKALPRCPAAKEWIMNAREAMESIGKPTDPDGRGELISAAKVAAKWADLVNDSVKEEVMAGQAATGWRLGAPRAIRTVSQVPAALQRLEQAGMGAQAAGALSLSLSKLPQEAADCIREFVTESTTRPSLIPERRKAEA